MNRSPLLQSNRAIFVAMVMLALLGGCSQTPIAFGVVIWSDLVEIRTGSTQPIYAESDLRDSYILNSKGEEPLELSRWRVATFDSIEEAGEYARIYSPYADRFMLVTRDGALLRSGPVTSADRVYKLRQDQELKLLEKMQPAEEINDTFGNWYRVLTSDGIEGYCFGSSLVEKSPEGDGALGLVRNIPEVLDSFLSNPFYPGEYAEMIRESRIDLRRFSRNFGVFPDHDMGIVRISTPDYGIDFVYNTINEEGEARFRFGTSGLTVVVISPEEVSMEYEWEGKSYRERYILLEEIEEVVDGEIARRRELLASLARMNGGTSSAYGTIRFMEQDRFNWTGFERLPAHIIPDGTSGRGVVSLDYFPGTSLLREYEGVLTLRFMSGEDREAVFLFNREPAGIKMVAVSPEGIEDGVVGDIGYSPQIIFFAATNPAYLTPPATEELLEFN